MEILLIAIVCTAIVCTLLNAVCFLVGARVGQKASKGEPVELPSLNPAEAIREHKERKVADSERGKIDAILRNIEKYNGTGLGQEDVPRG